MRYTIVRTKRFKTAFKRVSKLPAFDAAVFTTVVEQLALGEKLDLKYRDHRLSGNLKSLRECHLAPDILLIYQIDDGLLILTLVTIGSHSQLFK